jgi:hypothetical protein
VRAAEASWASSFLRSIPDETKIDIWYRTAGLLEKADDPNAIAFENVVLPYAYKADFGSERNQHINVRMKALSERATESTFDTLANDAMTAWSSAFMGLMGGTMNEEDAPKLVKTCVEKWAEGGDRDDCPPGVRLHMVLWGPSAMTYWMYALPQEDMFNPEELSSEEQLIECINEYQSSVHGRAGKERFGMDYMLHGASW